MRLLKLAFVLLLLPAASLCSMPPGEVIRSTLDTLGAGLKNKHTGTIRKTFAPDMSIGTGTGAGVDNFLEPILKNVNFEAVVLLSGTFRVEGDLVYASVKFVLQQNKYQESIIAFNKDGKIVFVDYFDRLFGQSRYQRSSLMGSIPFRLDDRSVVLSIRLNGSDRLLSFLLDTGADGMAIRKSLADSLGIKTNYRQSVNIVGGQTQIDISSGNTVHLTDSLSMSGQNIALFDKIRHNLDGIIGLNLMKKYITKIDFNDRKIYLYSFGNYYCGDDEITIPIRVLRNLVVVPSELDLTGTGSIAGNFLMDTGANYYLIIFSDFVRKNRLLENDFKPESEGTTVSLGHATPVYHGKARELKTGGVVKNDIPVTLQTSSFNQSPQNNGPDGSLGIRFFMDYNLTIDLLRKEIHLEHR